MDIIVWLLTGGVVGWAGYSFLGFNEERGMKVSIVIGAAGALVGGKMIAPMFAAAVAAAFLALGNLLHQRWGV